MEKQHAELLTRWLGVERFQNEEVAPAIVSTIVPVSYWTHSAWKRTPTTCPRAVRLLIQYHTASAVAEGLTTGSAPTTLDSEALRRMSEAADVEWAYILGRAYARETERKMVDQ